MQDHFNKLVQVCFYGIIIFVGAVALGSKMGQVGPVLIFGLILFAIVLSTSSVRWPPGKRAHRWPG